LGNTRSTLLLPLLHFFLGLDQLRGVHLLGQFLGIRLCFFISRRASEGNPLVGQNQILEDADSPRMEVSEVELDLSVSARRRDLTAARLMRETRFPLDWRVQREALGFA
jgi:hypothetical protein